MFYRDPGVAELLKWWEREGKAKYGAPNSVNGELYSPEARMNGERKSPRSRRLYWLWVVALGVLGLALFIGTVVVPVWRTNAAAERCDAAMPSSWMSGDEVPAAVLSEIEGMGGAEKAADRLGFYLDLPDFAAPRKGSAVVVLLAACESASVDELLRLAGHSRYFVRGCAISAFEHKRDPRIPTAVIAAMDDPESFVRSSAVTVMTRAWEAEYLAPMVAALKDEDMMVRYEAATGLMSSREARAVEPLIGALADPNFNVRAAATRALGFIGDKRSVEPLRALQKDEEDEVRAAVADALRTLGQASEGEKPGGKP